MPIKIIFSESLSTFPHLAERKTGGKEVPGISSAQDYQVHVVLRALFKALIPKGHFTEIELRLGSSKHTMTPLNAIDL